MLLSDSDLQAIWLTVKLASLVTVVLLLIGTPIAWWLARTRSWLKGPIGAVVALPLVLPPSVLGFYMLLAMGPNGPIGHLTRVLGIGALPFTFWGLALAMVRMALHLRGEADRPRFDTVALSGGCFQNALLFETLATGLERAGFTVLSHREVPANDGGLALGQGLVALAATAGAGPCA